MSAAGRDILGELFAGDAGDAPQGLEELHALIQQCAAPRQAAVAGPKRRVSELSRTRKTTHYLRADVYEGLEATSLAVRKLLPRGVKVSKSRLVNLALEQFLEDVRRTGDASAVARLVEDKS